MIYVLGHQNPDTDTVASAIVYAQYLQDQGQDAEAIMLGHPNRETEFVLNYAGVSHPDLVTSLDPGSQIALVDHNEASQSIENRDQLHIMAVIDHHKVADIQTAGPLMMRVEPVGCTCTVLHEMFASHDYQPSSTMATLMISAILSDTLHFRSPTTTDRDKAAVASLAGLAGIDDIETYAMSMFDAKSDLTGIDATEIVTMDYKMFEMGEKKIAIGVMETTNPSFAREKEDELRSAMQMTKSNDKIDHLLFCVIDILHEQNTTLVLPEDEELVSKTFDVEVTDGKADLGARVSRKKQLVPVLHSILA